MECDYFTIFPQPLSLYWVIFRNITLHLFLVPYPFKIEASLQNSLSLQCTYLCIFDISQCMDFLRCWPGYLYNCEIEYWATNRFWPSEPTKPLKQMRSLSISNKTLSNNAPKCFLEIGKIVTEFVKLYKCERVLSTHREVCWSHVQKLKLKHAYSEVGTDIHLVLVSSQTRTSTAAARLNWLSVRSRVV